MGVRHGWQDLSLLRKGLVVVAVPSVAMLAGVPWLYQSERKDEQAAAEVRALLQTSNATERVLTLTLDIETGVRGYLLTGRGEYLDPYRLGERDVGPAAAQLAALVQDQPVQRQRVEDVISLVGQRSAIAANMVAGRSAVIASPSTEAGLLDQAKAIEDALRSDLGAVQGDALRQVDASLMRSRQAGTRRTMTLLVGALAAIASGLAALKLFSTGVARRIGLLKDNARLLANSSPLLTLPAGNDEIGQLGDEMAKTAGLLAEQQQYLKLSFEASRLIIWEYDPATGQISWPVSTCSAMSTEVRPGSLQAMLDRIEPEDRSAVEAAFRGAAAGEPLDIEFRVVVGGDLRWISARGRVVGDEPTRRLTGLSMDVTDRKVTELAIRDSEMLKSAILASIADAVVIADPAGLVVSINPAMERLSGWTNEEVRGHPLDFYSQVNARSQPVNPNDRLLARAIATGRPVATRGYELVAVSKDGHHIPLAGSASPIIGADGAVLGGVEVVRDVSFERDIDDLKSSLVSTVSHELRTPLTMIQGFSELILTRRPSPEKTEEALRHINTSALRLARLIEDLLTVSRIESGRTEVRAVPLELGPFLEDAVHQFVDRRRVNLDVQDGLPPLFADPDMLVQILTNLISNGIKYSPRESPVHVAARREGEGIEISVTDHGVGMDEAEQAQLFQRFFRADREEVQAAGGTGLGLYITKNLVEIQGGRIHVETKLGEGSIFTFSLPLAS